MTDNDRWYDDFDRLGYPDDCGCIELSRNLEAWRRETMDDA